ncbi:hypothetical protein M011DRAFT_514631 [Sporormia fimetaria CBS 119925]|uniref:Uncharacterized protein n=1 Tax=Sporormia fimetaria CBS 119925 TaxID=1340428 RepID=A0A6A6VH64_9PLEO|nr:hypothetical protein M011DRAFT_514631 [Sporormia fimetaria CBS 119925]
MSSAPPLDPQRTPQSPKLRHIGSPSTSPILSASSDDDYKPSTDDELDQDSDAETETELEADDEDTSNATETETETDAAYFHSFNMPSLSDQKLMLKRFKNERDEPEILQIEERKREDEDSDDSDSDDVGDAARRVARRCANAPKVDIDAAPLSPAELDNFSAITVLPSGASTTSAPGPVAKSSWGWPLFTFQDPDPPVKVVILDPRGETTIILQRRKAWSEQEFEKVHYEASATVRQHLAARIWHDNVASSPAWIFVAWVLGLANRFRPHLLAMIEKLEVAVQEDGSEELRYEGRPLPGPFPTAVLTYIKAEREAYISKLLAVTYAYVDHLERGNICAAPEKHEPEECAARLCGTFVRAIAKSGLGLERASVREVELSVAELEARLKSIKYPKPGWIHARHLPADLRAHQLDCQTVCVWYLKIDMELAGIGEVPTEFERYLSAQEKKRVG